jgi:hypothetical protein
MDGLTGPSVSWKGRTPASKKNFQKPLDLIGRFLVDFLLNPKLAKRCSLSNSRPLTGF